MTVTEPLEYIMASSVNPVFCLHANDANNVVLKYAENHGGKLPVYDASKVIELVPSVLGFDARVIKPKPIYHESQHWIFEYLNVFKWRPKLEDTPLYYDVLERGYVAALELGELATARAYFDHIENRFPTVKSQRSTRLYGMLLEAQGQFDEALKYYRRCLNDWDYEATDSSESKVAKVDEQAPSLPPKENSAGFTPHVAFVLKRMVAVRKAQGRITDAVNQLCEYLDTFQLDLEAWFELSCLYVELASKMQGHERTKLVAAAVYALEEAIILSPVNHLLYIALATIQLQMTDRTEEALRSYLRVVSLFNGELSKVPRAALVGISLACKKLLGNIQCDMSKETLERWSSLVSKFV